MERYVVSLTRNVWADSEEEAIERFVEKVIGESDYDADSLAVELDPEE